MYDQNQWTMRSEMVGSLSLYTALIATSGFTPVWRCAALVFMDAYCLYNPDTFYTGVCFFTGAILADLSLTLEDTSTSSTAQYTRGRGLIKIVKLGLPIILAIFAVYVGSYPEENPDHYTWSKTLHQWGDYIAPGRTVRLV